MNDNLHQLRCFGCGSRIAGADAQPDFRCAQCGDLFEVEYPGWSQRGGNDRPNPGALKWLWRERRCSGEPLDASGVWRFRELLPILDSFGNAISLREGNTPLYHLPRAAKALGIDRSCCLAMSKEDDKIIRSARNIPKTTLTTVRQLNAWDIMNKRTLLVTKAGLELILA